MNTDSRPRPLALLPRTLCGDFLVLQRRVAVRTNPRPTLILNNAFNLQIQLSQKRYRHFTRREGFGFKQAVAGGDKSFSVGVVETHIT